ncbi:MAG: DUF418 domain-containing protein [Arachnia propionica]|uniref:DUF418 domain-containing protein n=1 Tax=Arachnia propionica TaxID=1750 RepID=UPI0026F79FB7|nr:DUF418 domain-containing protein [Arachnia propionica]
MHQTTSAAQERIRVLDVLRGIAILGTLASNIFVWVVLPGDEVLFAENVQMVTVDPLRAVLGQFSNGKFLALLTLMFGMGLLIQHDSARSRGRRWPQVYIWRAVLLFLDGVLHYVLVFQFDVLMSYSLTGMVVAHLLLTSPRTQRVVWIVATSIHLAIVVTYDFLTYFRKDVLEAMLGAEGEAERYIPATWWEGVVDRATNLLHNRMEALMILPMTFSTFLLGAYLLRRGLFRPEGARMRRWLMAVGALVFALDMFLVVAPVVTPLPFAPTLSHRYLLPVFVALGVAAAAAQFYLTREPGWVGRRLEDVGRMALSCYVGQNVVCMFLLSDWALNLDGRFPASFGAGTIVSCFLLVALILLVFAHLWRRLLGQGPLERLWAVSYRAAMRLTPGWGASRS